jgi:PAS domain S-box-containing protein
MVEPANKILKALLELIPAGVAVLDANHQVIDFNTALVKILGISEERLRAREYANFRYCRLDGTLMPREEFPNVRGKKEQTI